MPDTKIKTPSIKPEDLIRKVAALQIKPGSVADSQRDEEVQKLIKKAVVEYAEIAEQANERPGQGRRTDDTARTRR